MASKGRTRPGGAEHGLARWIGSGGEIPTLIEYMKRCKEGRIGLSSGVKPLEMYDTEIKELVSLVEQNITQLSRENERRIVLTYVGRPESTRIARISLDEEKRERTEYRNVVKRLAGSEKTMLGVLEKQIRTLYIAKGRAEKYRMGEKFSGEVASNDDYRDSDWMEPFITQLEDWFSGITQKIQDIDEPTWINNTQRPAAIGKTKKKKSK